MFVERCAKKIKIAVKQQGIWFWAVSVCVLAGFPLAVRAYYAPGNFKNELHALRAIQILIPAVSFIWELQFMENRINGKKSDLINFIDPKPWKTAIVFDILFLFLTIVSYGVVGSFGLKIKSECEKTILLSVLIQSAAFLLIILMKSQVLTLAVTEVLLACLSFESKSPFLWNREHTSDTKRVTVYYILAVAGLWMLSVVYLWIKNAEAFVFFKKLKERKDK